MLAYFQFLKFLTDLLAFKTQIVLFNAVKWLINSARKELTLRKLKMLNLARSEIFCVRNFAPMNHLYSRPFSALYNFMPTLITPPPLKKSYAKSRFRFWSIKESYMFRTPTLINAVLSTYCIYLILNLIESSINKINLFVIHLNIFLRWTLRYTLGSVDYIKQIL